MPLNADDAASNVTKVLFFGLQKHANLNQDQPVQKPSAVAPDDGDDLWDNLPV
jgi:hypothetical protein